MNSLNGEERNKGRVLCKADQKREIVKHNILTLGGSLQRRKKGN